MSFQVNNESDLKVPKCDYGYLSKMSTYKDYILWMVLV
jgi:hypothetical protein